MELNGTTPFQQMNFAAKDLFECVCVCESVHEHIVSTHRKWFLVFGDARMKKTLEL